MHVGIRRGESFEVTPVSRDDHPSAGFYRRRNRVRVGHVRRAGPSRRENSANEPSERSIRVANEDAGVSAEACVNDLVVSRTAIQLGKNDSGRDHVTPQTS